MLRRPPGRFMAAAMGLALLVLTVAACSKEERYAEYVRPDGHYKVVVFRRVQKQAMMPGQASDAPGRVILFDAADRPLREASVQMVQLVETVAWGSKTVHISAIGEWPLPD